MIVIFPGIIALKEEMEVLDILLLKKLKKNNALQVRVKNILQNL
jgi:hypothetical protein